jgi:hypothetical protein
MLLSRNSLCVVNRHCELEQTIRILEIAFAGSKTRIAIARRVRLQRTPRGTTAWFQTFASSLVRDIPTGSWHRQTSRTSYRIGTGMAAGHKHMMLTHMCKVDTPPLTTHSQHPKLQHHRGICVCLARDQHCQDQDLTVREGNGIKGIAIARNTELENRSSGILEFWSSEIQTEIQETYNKPF